jgi:carboxyl-terminal processing protease
MFEAVTMLRGKPDTYVNITIYRPATNEFLGFDIPRVILDNPTVEYKVMDNNIGYIQIIQFTNNTAEEFEYAISELKQLNVQKLILDLRNNPGDDMESTMKIADILFPAERTIYFVRSKSSLIDKEFVTLNDTWWAVPLVILINEGSASSAEILAGAVQDHTRGVIIGAKSFGKGLKQSIITLPNSAGISLTTYKYYTPTGRPIHTGIIPDIIITEHDKQLQKAIEVVNNLTLPVASTYDTL